MAGMPGPRADRNFYVGVALAVALVVAVGFGGTVNARLFHPSSPRPRILYVHAALFTAWVLLFTAQAMLVRSGRVAWHRRLGIVGIVLGGLMPVVGIATALAMVHNERFLIVSFFDMLAFGITFGRPADSRLPRSRGSRIG
jgi:hypothetical protein